MWVDGNPPPRSDPSPEAQLEPPSGHRVPEHPTQTSEVNVLQGPGTKASHEVAERALVQAAEADAAPVAEKIDVPRY